MSNVKRKKIKTKKTGLKREILDKYYTTQSTVNICMSLFKQQISITDKDLCVEPSAGNGSFATAIKDLFSIYKFYDIQPENEYIEKFDYLDFNIDKHISTEEKMQVEKIHVIGNPPFGRQSTLAIKFIKISCSYCDTLSFILPKSFKKESMKKYFPLTFHLKCEFDLPKNSFIVDDKEHDVPCVFQIWEKKEEERKIAEKLEPYNFKFVKKETDHDISFRRVGINAGVIDKNTSEKSHQSHYFIKFVEGVLTDETFQQIKNLQYENSENTVGPKSISKQELIKEFNMILKRD